MQLVEYTHGTAGPRILLVHGLSSSAGSWWRVIEMLEADAQLTAVDLRGHGATGPADSYTLPDFASDLPGDGWDAVVGHSLGGAAAVLAAQRPGFTRRLLLLDPVLEVTEEEWDATIADQLDELDLTADRLAELKPHWHERDRAQKLEGVSTVVPEVVSRVFTDAGRWNVIEEARALTVPTLILGGDPDVYTMLAPHTVEDLVDTNPHIRFTAVARAAHSPHRDRPQETLDLMREWLLAH